MNRLIIIGNGFDLAHGLKSKYEDFVFDYLKNAAKAVYKDDVKKLIGEVYGYKYEDELVAISNTQHFEPIVFHHNLNLIDSIDQLLNFLESNGFRINIKSPILKNFIGKDNKNWVDFEIAYFNEVKKILSALGTSNQKYTERLTILNQQFETIKNKLIEYLKEQESSYSNLFQLHQYGDLFTEPILEKEISLETVTTHKPNNILFLNFNYTNTVKEYIRYCRDKKVNTQINYIHGKLNDSENPIIFGFGDEYDQKYIELEHLNNNKLFEHIKSFGYLKTDNYANLTRFVNAEKFQVHIYGHSCGLSDRTMFKEIFEHENCKSIKIFFHQRSDGSNDFTDKCYDIYRHFTNKNLMRNKVVNELNSIPMPQI